MATASEAACRSVYQAFIFRPTMAFLSVVQMVINVHGLTMPRVYVF